MAIQNNSQVSNPQIEQFNQPNANVGNNSIAIANNAIIKNVNSLTTQSLANMHEADKTRLVTLTHNTEGKSFFGRIQQIAINIAHNIKHLVFKDFQASAIHVLNNSTAELTLMGEQILRSNIEFSQLEKKDLNKTLIKTANQTYNTLKQIIGFQDGDFKWVGGTLFKSNFVINNNNHLTSKLNEPLNKAITDCLSALDGLQQVINREHSKATNASNSTNNNVQNTPIEQPKAAEPEAIKEEPAPSNLQNPEPQLKNDSEVKQPVHSEPIQNEPIPQSDDSFEGMIDTLYKHIPSGTIESKEALISLLTKSSDLEGTLQQLGINTSSLPDNLMDDLQNEIILQSIIASSQASSSEEQPVQPSNPSTNGVASPIENPNLPVEDSSSPVVENKSSNNNSSGKVTNNKGKTGTNPSVNKSKKAKKKTPSYLKSTQATRNKVSTKKTHASEKAFAKVSEFNIDRSKLDRKGGLTHDEPYQAPNANPFERK
ncbi:MAG: hypothetical protein MJ218_02185 [Opitutales bacterium]|nr:hypothetical protein [Opitutales bacterium]